MRALGRGVVEIEPPQGMASESASAAVILSSTDFVYTLSTTHVVTGSGLGKTSIEVRWHIARRMVTAWLLTLPAAGVVGTLAHGVAQASAGWPG
ncbi:inorganic phosphate transporter [Kitasatospora sp. LaBMicrA B282]|uniref:inorganic phosphate transporter n=1 Tax=Kitasatospora sp. LaBMicrA B282 TaxID=3420949 RepID=UPI003D0E76FE